MDSLYGQGRVTDLLARERFIWGCGWGTDHKMMASDLGDDQEPLIAYHGTPRIESVLEHGIQAKLSRGPDACVWMALRYEDAAVNGDVVEIDLSRIEGDWPRVEDGMDGVIGERCWQAHYGQSVPPEALKRIEHA